MIHRGVGKTQRVVLELPATTELVADDSLGTPELSAVRLQRGFRTDTPGSSDDEIDP